MPPVIPESIMALDVGDKRVGVSLASLAARFPHPHTTLERGETILAALQGIVETEKVGVIIVGLPRGLSGQETAQTAAAEAFAVELGRSIALPIHFQDEALTSKKAEAELEARGKSYVRGDIDALAATYILDDFLTDHREQELV